MGWTVLYIAFGVVALWLLGEVLLQYKARLRWRLLAFAGFLGVVVGVLMPSVLVIGAGAVAFAIGQTYVTLSFRRGFASGWAVKRPEAEAEGTGSKRRRGRGDRQEPALEVSGLEAADTGDDRDADLGHDLAYGDDDRDDVFTPAGRPEQTAAESTAVYAPQPMPEDTGSYGVYGEGAYAGAAQQQGADQTYAYDYSGYAQQGYGYDNGQQGYANYSDPYIGTQSYGGASYGTGYEQQYGQQGYGQDGYTTGGYGETPAGGVWVPQQRSDETYGGELPQEQHYPYQGDEQRPGAGYDEQYRF
ncbi:SCO2102 family sporulation regulator [Streptomyces collinus]|uniref:SCO2102 family sporulation regulator n=1 Tax=Streptomyces collinus TaxID=42684 RepID=UPI00369C3800